ncbi:hypothetical protein GCM10028820_32870 [Tessaracoccus terricola]
MIGDYQPATRPEPAPPSHSSRRPTLLERLKARFRGEAVESRKGPDFQQPEGAARVGRYEGRRRNRSSDQPRHRPTGYESND